MVPPTGLPYILVLIVYSALHTLPEVRQVYYVWSSVLTWQYIYRIITDLRVICACFHSLSHAFQVIVVVYIYFNKKTCNRIYVFYAFNALLLLILIINIVCRFYCWLQSYFKCTWYLCKFVACYLPMISWAHDLLYKRYYSSKIILKMSIIWAYENLKKTLTRCSWVSEFAFIKCISEIDIICKSNNYYSLQ